jgi:hypothetical protein
MDTAKPAILGGTIETRVSSTSSGSVRKSVCTFVRQRGPHLHVRAMQQSVEQRSTGGVVSRRADGAASHEGPPIRPSDPQFSRFGVSR